MSIPTIHVKGVQNAAIGKDKNCALIILSTHQGPDLPLEFDAVSITAVASVVSQYAATLSLQTATQDHQAVRAVKLHALKATPAEGSDDVVLSLSSTPEAWMHFSIPASEIDEFCARLKRAKSDFDKLSQARRH